MKSPLRATSLEQKAILEPKIPKEPWKSVPQNRLNIIERKVRLASLASYVRNWGRDQLYASYCMLIPERKRERET